MEAAKSGARALPQVAMVGYAGLMSRILCLDTSGPHCSLALSSGEQVFRYNEQLGRRHNEVVLNALDDLFEEARTTPAELDALGFCAGPGSFTGVRIAAAICQAIAYVADAKVLPIASDRALYLTAKQQQAVTERCVVSIKSRAELFYVSVFEQGAAVQPPTLCDAPPAFSIEGTLLGERPPWWTGESAPLTSQVDAAALIAEVDAARVDDRLAAPDAALPMYFSGDSPWRPQRPTQVVSQQESA